MFCSHDHEVSYEEQQIRKEMLAMEERAKESKLKLAQKQKELCELMRTVLSYRRMLDRNQNMS